MVRNIFVGYRSRVVLCFCATLMAGTAPTIAMARPMYVPNFSSTKQSWKCNGSGVSYIELESSRRSTDLGNTSRVLALQVGGAVRRPTKIAGLVEFVGLLDFLANISARCGTGGEEVIVSGWLRGQTAPEQKQERRFWLSYNARP